MRKNIAFLMTGSALALRAVFEPNKSGWLLDENGAMVVRDGNPVYVNATGQEMTLGTDTVGRLNAEAKQHRERAEAAETALKSFEGLDAAKARDALTLVEKIDQKALIDGGKVDELKAQITTQYEAKLSERDAKLADVQKRLDDTVLTAAFSGSKFIAESINIPADMFQASFAKNFQVRDGNIVPVGADGKEIYSKKRLGEIADFDEAASILVDSYAHRDAILKAPQKGGSGNTGQGGNRATGSIMKRSEFAALSSAEQAASAAKMRAGEVQLIDG